MKKNMIISQQMINSLGTQTYPYPSTFFKVPKIKYAAKKPVKTFCNKGIPNFIDPLNILIKAATLLGINLKDIQTVIMPSGKVKLVISAEFYERKIDTTFIEKMQKGLLKGVIDERNSSKDSNEKPES